MSNVILTNQVQYAYSTFPKTWVGLYQKLHYLYVEYGLDTVKDCKAVCSERSTKIIDCYNIFNAAVSAFNIGRKKEADLIYNYLSSQMKLYYPNMKVSNYNLYIGGGTTKEDVLIEDNHIAKITTIVGNYSITLNNDDYIFVIFSKDLDYSRITFNGFDIPFEDVELIKYADETYKCLKSSNTYQAGSYIIKIE